MINFSAGETWKDLCYLVGSWRRTFAPGFNDDPASITFDCTLCLRPDLAEGLTHVTLSWQVVALYCRLPVHLKGILVCSQRDGSACGTLRRCHTLHPHLPSWSSCQPVGAICVRPQGPQARNHTKHGLRLQPVHIQPAALAVVAC